MPLRSVRRRGVQLLELLMVLPIVGIVLTATALSVAGTQRALERVQQQAVELATVDRFTQQLREDVHRAIRPPELSGQTLEIERLEGTVRYVRSEAQLIRQIELPDGGVRATFEIATGDSPWTIAAEDRLVRFEREHGNEIVAAWSEIEEASEENPQSQPAEESP